MSLVTIDVDFDEIAQLFSSLNESLARLGINPIRYSIVSAGCDPDTAAANLAEPQSAYDVGDLLSEIDEAMGPIIERTAHRYLPKPMAQDIRKKFVRQVADTAIQYDKLQNK